MNKKALKLEQVGEATEAEMNKWKAKFKGKNQIKRFEVVDDCKKYIGYFKKPSLELVQAAEAQHASDVIAKNDYLLNNSFLGGAKEFTEDDEFRFAIATAVSRSFRILVGEVKNV